MAWISEIYNFLEEYADTNKLEDDSDLYEAGIKGDDFHNMIKWYTKNYSVDMSNYLWYFHTDEEGQNFGGLFFKPPYKRVERIPITPRLLAKFIKTKKWDIDYPNHSIPKLRVDLMINWIMILLFLIVLIWSLVFN